MKLNLKRFSINKLTIITLIISLVFAQLGLAFPSYAAPTFEISPKAVSGSTSKRITVTSNENSFTAGESTPYIMKNSSVVGEAAISSVDSQLSEVSFTLGSGLSDGDYDVRIVDPKGTYDVGTITVGDPSVNSISPNSLAKEYSNQEITVAGINTNFELGKTTVEILNSQDQVVDYVDSITAVSSNTSLKFKLKDGLASGTYSMRVSTDDEILTASNILEVRGTAAINLSLSSINEGYSTTTINVTGTNTAFSDSPQTIVSIIGESSVVGSITIVDQTNLSFSLNSGLQSGIYTVEVKTLNEEAQATLTVNAASAQIQYQGSNLDEIPVGYTSPYTLALSGTNTSFQSGTTQITLYDGNPDTSGNDITSSYITNTNISRSSNISFQLGTGLGTGTYYLRAVTGNQTVQDTFTIVSPQITNVSFNSDVVSSNKVPEGYENMTVDITGQDTLFKQGTTTVEIDGQTNQTETIIVEDSTHLSFSLKKGLSGGSYTIVVDIDGDGGTTSDQATYQFTVTSPNITSVSPDSIINTSSSNITITVIGEDTHFISGNQTIDILGESSEAISNIVAVTDTKLTFSLTQDSISSSGNYDIKITTSGGSIVEEVTDSSAINVSSSGIGLSPSSVYKDELGTKEIVVTGYNTNFVSNDTTVEIDNNSITGVEVNSTSQLRFTIPDESYLTEGTHTLKVSDGSSNTYTTNILVDSRSISISPDEKDFEYSDFTMTVTGQGVTFNTTDKKPQVSISGEGSVAVNDSDINSTDFTFDFPTGLEVGTYTVTVTWNGLDLTDTITIDKITSDIYFKHDGIKKSTVNVDESKGSISLEAWSELISGGDDDPVTSKADWKVESGSDVVSVNSSGVVTLNKVGSATVSAIYGGVKKNINIVVAGEGGSQLPATLTRISIDPSNPVVNVDKTTNLTATATYSDQSTKNITDLVTWTSDKPSIATVGAATGAVKGIAEGTAKITISYENESNYVVVTVKEAGDSSTGGGGGGGATDIPEKRTIGNTLADIVLKDLNGIQIEEITLDEDSAIEEIKNIVGQTYTLLLGNDTSNVDIKVSNKTIEELKKKGEDAVLELKSGMVEYQLPAQVIDLSELKKSLGSEDISFSIVIKEPTKPIRDKMNEIAAKENIKMISSPVEFKVEALAGGKTQEIEDFKSKYVTRKITLNSSVDFSRAVGVVFNEENNTYVHVPTRFYNDENGNVVAEIMKKGNSIYTVLEKHKSFTDMEHHWAKDNVETLASKFVINGMTEDQFAPNEKITRAQFAALLVRALGLKVNNNGNSSFTDIKGTDWFKGVVNTAADEGLVTGYDDGSFKPNKTISRQEMAIMVVRALRVAEKDATISNAEKNSLLEKFNDKQNISSWSQVEVAIAVKEGIITGKSANTFVPKDNATRAEAATMLIRMMRAVGFIN